MATELDLDDVVQYSPLAQRELADLRAELDNALGLIRMRGVSETRAEHLPHALDVLLTRLDKEIQAQRIELANLHRQVLVRTEDMEEDVVAWNKTAEGRCKYLHATHESDCYCMSGWGDDSAPDYRPDEEGPIFLVIVEPPE